MLPPHFNATRGQYDEEIEEFLASTERALGIWFGVGKESSGHTHQSWAFHLTKDEGYGQHGIAPQPAVLEERECSLVSSGGRVWSVAEFVTDSRELGTYFHLTAYSKLATGLYVRGGGSGSGAEAASQSLAILASYDDRGL